MLLKVLEQASQATFDLELDDDTTIGTVKLLVEMDSDVPAAEMFLSLSDGSLLDNDEFTLAAYSINDNTQLLMARGHPPQLPAATSSSGGVMNVDWNAIMRGMTQASRQPQGRPTAIPPAAIAQFRERVFNNPYEMSHYRLNSPELASAIESNDTKTLGDILLKSQQAQYDRDSERRELEMKAMQDPMNVDVQRRIEELIQAENVEQSRQQAMEHMPESFASVVMLYINVVVNGYPIKAFVDSGAQMTIMSQACAERCGIARLVDKRYHGMAVGVGSQRILGRVHMYEIEVAGAHLPTSFSILEQQPMDMLLGLDMLKRHQCSIDLKRNVLFVGTTGTETPFLGESEIPRSERLGQDAPSSSTDPAETANSTNALASEANADHVAQLMAMGFTQPQAVEALTVSNGDVDRAAAYLLNAS